MARIVISDTSPIRYLILLERADLLAALYAEVVIPETVFEELNQPATPEPVRRWIARKPAWLCVVPPVTSTPSLPLPDLDAGERDAILLALHLKADLILMDERDGVEHAQRLGLAVVGTLGILDRAAERGLIELAPVIARLRQTNFRVDPALLEQLLAADALRRRK